MPIWIQDTEIGHFILAGEGSRKMSGIVKNCEGEKKNGAAIGEESGATRLCGCDYCWGGCAGAGCVAEGVSVRG